MSQQETNTEKVSNHTTVYLRHTDGQYVTKCYDGSCNRFVQLSKKKHDKASREEITLIISDRQGAKTLKSGDTIRIKQETTSAYNYWGAFWNSAYIMFDKSKVTDPGKDLEKDLGEKRKEELWKIVNSDEDDKDICYGQKITLTNQEYPKSGFEPKNYKGHKLLKECVEDSNNLTFIIEKVDHSPPTGETLSAYKLQLKDKHGKDRYGHHTYVAAKDAAGNVLEPFCCYGGHADGDLVIEGTGQYEAANCYRGPKCGTTEKEVSKPEIKDDACLGKYAKNGVCHQATNRFLMTAGQVIDHSVQAYWLSVSAYGVYGLKTHSWKKNCFDACCGSISLADEFTRNMHPLFEKISILHDDYRRLGEDPDLQRVIAEELSIVTEHAIPGFEFSRIADAHQELLQVAFEIQGSDLTCSERVERINQAANEFARDLAEKTTREEYRKLIGQDPGLPVAIADENSCQ